MNSIIRIASAINKVSPANPSECFKNITLLLKSLEESPADIVVFPKLALSSPSCGTMFRNIALLDSCAEQLDLFCIATRSLNTYFIIGLPINDCGRTVSVCAVIYRGEVIGYVPTLDNPKQLFCESYSDMILPIDTIFSCGDISFSVLSCDPLLLPAKAELVAKNGCDLIITPSYSPVVAGYIQNVEQAVKTTSKTLGCAIAVVNGGVGDTSSPYLYRGFSYLYECGEKLDDAVSQYENVLTICDVDTDIIRSQKYYNNYTKPYFISNPVSGKFKLLRRLSKNPYLPADPQECEAYVAELFDMQAASLAARLQNTGIDKVVLGISGGIDSTLAILVAAKTMDLLHLPREHIIAVTMPGLGTSDRTYFNSLSLVEKIGANGRDISIKASVMQHFEDIGHDPSCKDTTYENAQARERTQILLDIANTENALVIGTGDLSELALGWCTFAGDHIANYNVNVCVTKTTAEKIMQYVIKYEVIEDVAEVLTDILDTPISPELLPPDEIGDISQVTEKILGPYILHEFFLYYFVRYGFRPSKLYYYACIAFSGQYDTHFIKEKLVLFIKRFTASQFKRACAPDSATISEISLANINYDMPSDFDGAVLLKDIEHIEF